MSTRLDLADVVAQAEAFLQDVRRAGRTAGLTPLETKALLVLEPPRTSHELAALLGIGHDDYYRSALRRVVVDLRKGGLVAGGDRRGVLSPLYLTPAGARLRAELIDVLSGNGTSSPEETDAECDPSS